VIDLYAAPTSNGVRAKIILDECGLPYTLHKINMQAGDHKKPEYLKLNPNGAIPTIVDSDGPGGKPVTVTQSVAILHYCAQKAGKFLPKDSAGDAAMWEALMHVATDVSPTIGAVFQLRRAKEPHKPSQELFESKVKTYLKVWDDKLAKQKYCLGNDVTIVDFALYGVYWRLKSVAPDLAAGMKNLDRWEAEIASRPGTKKGLAFG